MDLFWWNKEKSKETTNSSKYMVRSKSDGQIDNKDAYCIHTENESCLILNLFGSNVSVQDGYKMSLILARLVIFEASEQ